MLVDGAEHDPIDVDTGRLGHRVANGGHDVVGLEAVRRRVTVEERRRDLSRLDDRDTHALRCSSARIACAIPVTAHLVADYSDPSMVTRPATEPMRTKWPVLSTR